MKVEYDIEIPHNVRNGKAGRTEEYKIFMDFVESNHKTMYIDYEDGIVASRKVTIIRELIKYKKLNNIKASNRDTKVYIMKKY